MDFWVWVSKVVYLLREKSQKDCNCEFCVEARKLIAFYDDDDFTEEK